MLVTRKLYTFKSHTPMMHLAVQQFLHFYNSIVPKLASRLCTCLTVLHLDPEVNHKYVTDAIACNKTNWRQQSGQDKRETHVLGQYLLCCSAWPQLVSGWLVCNLLCYINSCNMLYQLKERPSTNRLRGSILPPISKILLTKLDIV